ncbi:hypothetical protein D3C81_685430 [compost metagenome]
MQLQGVEQIGQHLLQCFVHVAVALTARCQQIADFGAGSVAIQRKHHADAQQRAVHRFAKGQLQLRAGRLCSQVVVDLRACFGRTRPRRVVPPVHHVRVGLQGEQGRGVIAADGAQHQARAVQRQPGKQQRVGGQWGRPRG